MDEIQIQNKIRVRISELGHTVFRNNVGSALMGKISEPPASVLALLVKLFKFAKVKLIFEPRRVGFGLCPGSADLIGITSCGLFLAIEVKRPGQKPRKDQLDFLRLINDMGGIAFYATSDDEAEMKLNDALRLRGKIH